MTIYTVYLSEAVPNSEKELAKTFDFYRVSDAKRFIKQHLDIYKDSCVTKVWANGEWEILGKINIGGSNKHFIANSGMKKANY